MTMLAAQSLPRFPHGDRRTGLRTYLSVPVMIETANRREPAHLHNLSEDGAMIEGPFDLRPGDSVVMHCGSIAADGTVAWQSENRIGIVFDQPLDETQIVRQILCSSATAHRRHLELKHG